ncbi:hypothetical protein D9M71_383330 [compost metagenome]
MVVAFPEVCRFARVAAGLEELGAFFHHVRGLRLTGQVGLQLPGVVLLLQDIEQAFTPGRVPGFRQALGLQEVVGLQALGQHQPGLRIIAGAATVQLFEGRLRVAARQPVDRFQAGPLQVIAQLPHQLRLVALPRQFPQLLALRGLRQFSGR